MTTQQTKVDWDRPIEAVHEDGRVMTVAGIHDWANDQWPHAGVADREHIYMRDDGRCSRATWGDMPGWRIRNVAQPEVPCNSKAPTPSPELTARMVGLEEALTWIADFVAKKRQGTDDWFDLAEIEQVARRAITAELEPVDGDWEQAKRLTAELFPYAAPQNEHALWKMAHAGLKAGRALAEAGK